MHASGDTLASRDDYDKRQDQVGSHRFHGGERIGPVFQVEFLSPEIHVMKSAEGAHVGVLVPAESQVLVLDPADELRLVVRIVADTAVGEQAGDHGYE